MPPKIPNDLIPADLIPAESAIPMDLIPADAIPSEIALPSADQMVPQDLSAFTQPTSILQQPITAQRAGTALISGALATPKLALTAYEFAQPPQPLKEEFARMGIEEPTFEQSLEKVSPGVNAIINFQPQTPIEFATEALGGIALETPKIATVGKATSETLKTMQAYDDAAGALFKRNRFSPAQTRFEQPAIEATTFTAQEARLAKTLDKTLTRQENKIIELNRQLTNPDLIPEEKIALEKSLLKVTNRREKLLRRGEQIVASEPYKKLQEAKTALNEKTVIINGRELPAYQLTISRRGVYVPPSEVEQLANQAQFLAQPGLVGLINKISAGPISTVDHLRLLQQADGNILQGSMYKLLFEPAEIAKRNRQTMILDETNAFRTLVNDLGLANMSKARKETLFDVADGVLPLEKANLTDQENKLLNSMAEKYSNYIDDVNRIRTKLDMPLVAKRKNYITHISEMSLFDELGFGLDSATADLQLKKMARPLKAKFGFEKTRVGGQYEKDPFSAFERYVNSVSKQIHYTEPAAVLNARTDFLADPVLKNAQKRFINEAFLDQLDFKDDVLVQLGARGPLNLAAKASNNFSVAAILANVTVTASQFSQIPATVKETGIWPTMVGLYRAFRPIPKQIADASSFLRLRQISDESIPLDNKVLNSARTFVLKGLEFTDKYVARASWEAGFVNAKRMGYSTEAAIKYADEVGRMLHANYGSIYKPSVLRGKTGQALLPLQSFFFNSWNYLSRDQKAIAELKNTTRLRETMKAIGAMAAANQMYEVMGLPAPFALEMPESTKPEELIRTAKTVTVGNMPAARILVEGVRPPAYRIISTELGMDKKSLMRNALVSVFSDDVIEQEKAKKELGKGALQFAPAGLQIKKTLEGTDAAKDGYVTIGREIIPLTEEDKRLAPIVGKYQVPSVRRARKEIERKKIRRQLEGK